MSIPGDAPPTDSAAELRIARPERLLRDQVTDTLRTAVIRGVFSPGDRLTERELVERTGVSRTSLREGLRQLQAEGLIEAAEGRGLRVTVFSDSDVAELYEVREYLESAAVELFITNAAPEQVAALADWFSSSSHTFGDRFDPGSDLYGLLFAGAGNALLRSLYESIAARIVMMQNLSVREPGRADASRAEMQETITLVRRRDAAGARDAARRHVRNAKDAALQALQRRRAGSA